MPSDRFSLTARLLRNILKYWHPFLLMLLCMIAVGLLQPLLPWMLAPLLDSAADQKKYLIPAQWLPEFMLLLIVLLGIFSYGRSYLGGWLDATLQRDYRRKMTQKLLQLPLQHLQQDTTGKLTSRFMLFLPQITSAIMPVCMALVQETIKAIGYISLMFYWDWKLTLIVLLVAPIGGGMIILLGKRMKKVAGATQEATASGQHHLNEMIAAAPVIKMAGVQTASTRIDRIFNAMRGNIIRMYVVISAGQPLTHILIALPFTVVLGYIINALAEGTMSTGVAASFLTIMLLLPTPVRIITRAMNTWEKMLVAAREVYGFLDTPTEPDTGTKQIERVRGSIEFCGITFSYTSDIKTPLTLDHFSFSIQANETIALVGPSGSGKSTLCNLLPRFYLPQQGNILLDGVNINDYTLSSLRRQIAHVPQKPMLFDDTVAMNIAFPNQPESNKVETALENAAADFVANLPKGIETRIGEDGDILSGGQKQRLMLARAFYSDCPIVILDEPTSALDSDTEQKIQVALQRLLRNRTTIIIAHRFSTINFADRIVVLNSGKLVATGNMDHLLKTCPLFTDLYKAQQLK